MNNDLSFHDAKRLYLEQYGDPMVTNTYVKIALLLLSLVAVGLGLIDLRTIRTFQNFRPLVIRNDQLGGWPDLSIFFLTALIEGEDTTSGIHRGVIREGVARSLRLSSKGRVLGLLSIDPVM